MTELVTEEALVELANRVDAAVERDREEALGFRSPGEETASAITLESFRRSMAKLNAPLGRSAYTRPGGLTYWSPWPPWDV